MKIIVVDDQKPEVVAMLQALYSRSPKSVVEHLEQVREKGPDKFMSTYYVGYGHKSIGDCGTTSIFIENVSVLAAKAIQDTPLYNGQEASTRYLDMAKQEVLNPLGTQEGKAIQDRWMALYSNVLAELVPVLKERFPRKDDEKEAVWEKAIKARAFDIARGLLPAGITTYVAWHSNLRQAHDHVKEMRNHPLPEVQDIARNIETSLKNQYPSSFGHKIHQEEEDYIKQSMDHFAFFDNGGNAPHSLSFFADFSRIDMDGLMQHKDLLSSRPPKTELHQRLRQYGNAIFRFSLDFGSYRDLQRQRSAVQEMPLLTTKHGFHPWYLEQMPNHVENDIESIRASVDQLDTDPKIKQYYTAIGYLVPVRISCPLPAAVYIAELRSGDTVHPTLRIVAQKMGEVLKEAIPELAMHHDMSPSSWNIKRGTQDIVKKS